MTNITKTGDVCHISLSTLDTILRQEYDYEIDDKTMDSLAELSNYRCVYVQGKNPKLYINNGLYSRQVKFILARELVLAPEVYSSVIVGFRIDADLKSSIRFIEDPAIPRVIINETCER